MEEAIASSQLEGAATTRKVAKEILRKNRKPRNKSEQMIVNGFHTIQRAVKLRGEKLTPKLILEFQKEITKDTLKDPDDVGKWRDNNEIVVADPIEEALHDMEKHIEQKQKEQAEAMKLIKGLKDINLRQAEILKEFIKNPEKAKKKCQENRVKNV